MRLFTIKHLVSLYATSLALVTAKDICPGANFAWVVKAGEDFQLTGTRTNVKLVTPDCKPAPIGLHVQGNKNSTIPLPNGPRKFIGLYTKKDANASRSDQDLL